MMPCGLRMRLLFRVAVAEYLLFAGSEDDDVDNELRLDAVTCYLELISKPSLPDILVKIMCWVSASIL